MAMVMPPSAFPFPGRHGNAEMTRTSPANVELPALAQQSSQSGSASRERHGEGGMRTSQSEFGLKTWHARGDNPKRPRNREPVNRQTKDLMARMMSHNIEDVRRRSASKPEFGEAWSRSTGGIDLDRSRSLPNSRSPSKQNSSSNIRQRIDPSSSLKLQRDNDFANSRSPSKALQKTEAMLWQTREKTEAMWAQDLLASLPTLRDVVIHPSLKRGEAGYHADAGEAMVVRKGSKALNRNAKSLESVPSCSSSARRKATQGMLLEDLSPRGGAEVVQAPKMHRGPLCLAHVSREWDLSLDILKEGSELFKPHAALPGFAPDEDILRDGLLDADGLIMVAMDLTKAASVNELPPDLCKDELIKFTNNHNDGRVDFKAFACWYQEHSFTEYVNLSSDAIHLRDFGHKLGLTTAEVEHYKTIYDRYDTDHSGDIDKEEFAHLMRDLTKLPEGLEFPASRLKHFWDECDLDGNGSIDLEEFIIFYTKHFDPDAEEPIADFYKGLRRT